MPQSRVRGPFPTSFLDHWNRKGQNSTMHHPDTPNLGTSKCNSCRDFDAASIEMTGDGPLLNEFVTMQMFTKDRLRKKFGNGVRLILPFLQAH